MLDCVVLGAGMAGIAAARELRLQGGHEVLVLEARDRIGGRIESLRDWLPLPVELGAEYIHVGPGEATGEFWAAIAAGGFRTQRIPKLCRGWVFFESWPGVKLWRLIQACDDVEIRPMTGLLDHLGRDAGVEDRSARQHVDAYDGGGLPLFGRGLRMAEYALAGHLPGALEEISVHGFLADRIREQLLEPDDHVLLDAGGRPCGYDALVANLAAPLLAEGAILLDRRVVAVRRPTADAVVVETADGSAYTARSAICTFPVGVLRREGGAIFGELLTDDKRAALEVIGMGPVTKVIVAFARRFWRRDLGILSHPAGRIRGFFNLHPGRHQPPHALVAYLVGPDAAELAERLDRDAEGPAAALRHVLRELAAIFPKAGLVPEAPAAELEARNHVTAWRMKAWAEDALACGGYSFLRLPAAGSRLRAGDARGALMDPAATRPLFWAGEATAPAYAEGAQPSSVHGAFASGLGAAALVRAHLAA